MPKNPNKSYNSPAQPPILRAEIVEAQRNTKSNTAAAKWLGVSLTRYKRYAELYGLYESHSNKAGDGIDKGFSKRPTSVPLSEIFAGNHPDYSTHKLKNRLLARKMLENKCNLCGFNEERILDRKQPLLLIYKDNNHKNKAFENLEILCYNCTFLTNGMPNITYRNRVLRRVERMDYHFDDLANVADAYGQDYPQYLEELT